MALTKRDDEILRDVWLYRYINTRQLSRLHFGHVKVAQRRLKILADKECLLDRFQQAHDRTWWYRLSANGAKLVASAIDKSASAVRPPGRKPRAPRFLEHHQLTTDFRIWLREACTGNDFGYQFIPEYEEVRGARHRRIAFSPASGKTLVPDGAFTLKKDNKVALFFLEADRGTEPLTGKHPSSIEKKFQGYLEAFESESAEKYFSSLFQTKFNGFRVLCLVPTQSRKTSFLNLAESLDLQPLIWVTQSSLVEREGDLDLRCWATSTRDPLRALSE